MHTFAELASFASVVCLPLSEHRDLAHHPKPQVGIMAAEGRGLVPACGSQATTAKQAWQFDFGHKHRTKKTLPVKRFAVRFAFAGRRILCGVQGFSRDFKTLAGIWGRGGALAERSDQVGASVDGPK